MDNCPSCGSEQYQIEEVNGTKIKKCCSCNTFYEDMGDVFEIHSFAPVYERDRNGQYPGCPKCGCREIHNLTDSELVIRGNPLAAFLFREPHLSFSRLSPPKYECTNPECRYIWN